MTIKFLDLFSGAGGLTDGILQSRNFEDIAAVEWLKPQVETLRNRLKNKWNVEDSDKRVMHFDIQRQKELFNGWRNDKVYGTGLGLDYFVNRARGIDAVIGGPPCQAYSIAGRVRDENGMRNDYRNYLFENYLGVVNRYKPSFFIFENVPGILSARPGGNKKVTELITEGFNNIGYDIIRDLKIAVVNSSDYGVPQNRKRVIILGVRKNLFRNEKEIQQRLHEFYETTLPSYKVKNVVTVGDAISDLAHYRPLPEIERSRKSSYQLIEDSGLVPSWHVPRFHNDRDINIYHMLAEDIESGENNYLDSKVLSKVYEEKVGSKSPIHRYHVLQPQLPSTTIIAHLKKDGNRFIHYDSKQSRTITPREAARLQSFDDDFDFCGSRGDVYQMIGNAVPPRLAKILGYAVNDFYEQIKHRE